MSLLYEHLLEHESYPQRLNNFIIHIKFVQNNVQLDTMTGLEDGTCMYTTIAARITPSPCGQYISLDIFRHHLQINRSLEFHVACGLCSCIHLETTLHAAVELAKMGRPSPSLLW